VYGEACKERRSSLVVAQGFEELMRVGKIENRDSSEGIIA